MTYGIKVKRNTMYPFDRQFPNDTIDLSMSFELLIPWNLHQTLHQALQLTSLKYLISLQSMGPPEAVSPAHKGIICNLQFM